MFVSVVSMSGTSGKHVTHWQGWLCLEFLLLGCGMTVDIENPFRSCCCAASNILVIVKVST